MASGPVDSLLAAAAGSRLESLCRSHPLGYVPRVVWRRYRVSAGLAYYNEGVIGLSTQVLKDVPSVLDTLTHEYAHLLAVARHGRKAAGHGEHWRQAMRDLGQEPKVRHCYSVERNTARQQVIYTCVRCGKALIRSRRLPKRRKYVHAQCGGSLKLTGVERVTPSS